MRLLFWGGGGGGELVRKQLETISHAINIILRPNLNFNTSVVIERIFGLKVDEM
jgi:hypothetical protein